MLGKKITTFTDQNARKVTHKFEHKFNDRSLNLATFLLRSLNSLTFLLRSLNLILNTELSDFNKMVTKLSELTKKVTRFGLKFRAQHFW